MNPFSAVWNGLISFLSDTLVVIHDVLEPIFGFDPAWGWAIIALTLIVRILMLPLAIKQTRSMKGMQAIQPKVKEIQKKHKVDRDLMKKDPELYQKKKAAQNEELMALYKEEGVNPAASCLPLLLQMPIFFALFRILGSGGDGLPDLIDAQFYFITGFVSAGSEAEGLGATISAAGWPGYLLIVMMAGSMFITQRQMMSRGSVEGAQATQQKIMMYVFPVFLAAISFGFPLAVVLYWVTTNIWQGVQQWLMFRVTSSDQEGPAGVTAKGGSSAPSGGTTTKKKDPAPKPRTSKKRKPGEHLPGKKAT